MSYYDDPDVRIAEQEMKRNKRANKKLAKMRSDDFTLYHDDDKFDMFEVTGQHDFGIGFSDDYR
jgi:hypothetical protein